MVSDIVTSYLSTTGNFKNVNGDNIQQARVKGLFVTGTGTITFKDGGASGLTRITINAAGQGNIQIPADGVRFYTDVYGTLGGTATVTMFYA